MNIENWFSKMWNWIFNLVNLNFVSVKLNFASVKLNFVLVWNWISSVWNCISLVWNWISLVWNWISLVWNWISLVWNWISYVWNWISFVKSTWKWYTPLIKSKLPEFSRIQLAPGTWGPLQEILESVYGYERNKYYYYCILEVSWSVINSLYVYKYYKFSWNYTIR